MSDEVLLLLEAKSDLEYQTGDCYNMLQAWWSKQSDGGQSALYHALNAVGMAAVANKHEGILCIHGKFSAEFVPGLYG